MRKAIVFLPKIEITEHCFLCGTINESNDGIAVYITSVLLNNDGTNCIGFCSENTPLNRENDEKTAHRIHFNIINSEITIVGHASDFQVILVHYDFNSFKESEEITSDEYKTHFQVLKTLIEATTISNRKKYGKFTIFRNLLYKLVINLMFFCNVLHHKGLTYERINNFGKHSALISHSINDIRILYLEMNKLVLYKKTPNKFICLLVCKVLDILLGFMVLYHLLQHGNTIIEMLENTMHIVIDALKQLLLILMGSPAGLKLNYAFNRTLGIFAFYNISLWRGFVHTVMPPLFSYALSTFYIPVLLGLSYQIALFTDVMAFTTFHVYCIYVYAARLYGLQIKMLASLWRLFIGRKYNPLRGKVDSYCYSHHQLFLGTLGFTILLFLLPTTLLYYTVFVTFRIGLIACNLVLEKLIFLLRCHPLVVLFLWLTDAALLKGKVYLQVKNRKNSYHLEAKLIPLSLGKAIERILPEFYEGFESNFSINLWLHKILLGELL